LTLKKHTILVLGVALATLGLAWPLALARLDVSARWAVVSGTGIALANTIAAHGLVVWGTTRRSTSAFLGAVLGGMVGRMVAMLAAVVVAVLLFGLPKLPLAVSLLSYFVVFLVMELSILNRHPGTPVGSAR
jgi:hypothetical protein